MRSFVVLLLLSCPSLVHAQTASTIAALVTHLDENPDMLHGDYTPSVWALCEHDLEGAIAVLPLLESTDRMTRLHASRVLSCGVSHHFGWRAGHGWPAGSDGERRFVALWNANGAYADDATTQSRHASAERWSTWLVAHRSDPATHTSTPAH